MMEPAVGASVWASGSHVWSGKTGTLIANARANAKNRIAWTAGGKSMRVRSARRKDHSPVSARWRAAT